MVRLAATFWNSRFRARRFRPPSSLAMAAANIGEIILPVARGVGLARLLTPEQFGIALTVTVTAGILELITDLGTGQLALKLTKDKALDTLHSVSVIRGVILGLIIAASGPVFGAIFKTEGSAWVYSLIGLSSIIRGFGHLEIKANMRAYNYIGEALNAISGQAMWTIVSLVGAFFLRDYRAMVFGLLAGVTANLIVSHVMAKRRWRLGWDRPTARDAMRFGGPLALNGMAFALTNLGDRTLTAARISLEQLAQYTALATSAFLPRSAVLKYLNSIFTPHFVNAEDAERQGHIGRIWLIVVSTIAGIFGLGYLAFGQVATSIVFGAAYHPPLEIVNLIGLLGAIRYMAGLPTPPALALNRNGILAQATVIATSGLALGALLLLYTPSLDRLVSGLIIGECASLLWVTIKICPIIHLPRRLALLAIFGPLVSLALITAHTYLLPDQAVTTRAIYLACGTVFQIVLTASLLHLSHIGLGDLVGFLFPRRTRAPSPV